jgi:hypothetical protein
VRHSQPLLIAPHSNSCVALLPLDPLVAIKCTDVLIWGGTGIPLRFLCMTRTVEHARALALSSSGIGATSVRAAVAGEGAPRLSVATSGGRGAGTLGTHSSSSSSSSSSKCSKHSCRRRCVGWFAYVLARCILSPLSSGSSRSPGELRRIGCARPCCLSSFLLSLFLRLSPSCCSPAVALVARHRQVPSAQEPTRRGAAITRSHELCSIDCRELGYLCCLCCFALLDMRCSFSSLTSVCLCALQTARRLPHLAFSSQLLGSCRNPPPWQPVLVQA